MIVYVRATGCFAMPTWSGICGGAPALSGCATGPASGDLPSAAAVGLTSSAGGTTTAAAGGVSSPPRPVAILTSDSASACRLPVPAAIINGTYVMASSTCWDVDEDRRSPDMPNSVNFHDERGIVHGLSQQSCFALMHSHALCKSGASL